jgi:hypothetical protein
MKGVFGLLLIGFIVLSTYDYYSPLGVPFFTENNPVDSVLSLMDISTQEVNSNIIPLPSTYNMDFEYGTIGWKTHNLYSMPPDYIESTFEDKKSGYQSLRLAFSCDTEEGSGIVTQTNHHLFRSSKLPEFDQNVYVKFYLKGKREYGNTWFDDPIWGLASATSFSITVQAIDEWGERIYTKNLISDYYDKDNSQIISIRTLETNNDTNATIYFEKMTNMDYNATLHGSLDEIQAMLDYQYSWSGSHVISYFATDNTLQPYVYAVYLGDGWYTVIMPLPKETRYLGFDITSYCYGATYGYTMMGVAFAPAVPASVNAVLYLDGITFIQTLNQTDITNVVPTSTIDTTGNTWTTNDDIIDDADDDDNAPPVTNNKFMIWIKTWWWVPIIIGLAFLAGLSSKTPKTKKKVRKTRKVKSK